MTASDVHVRGEVHYGSENFQSPITSGADASADAEVVDVTVLTQGEDPAEVAREAAALAAEEKMAAAGADIRSNPAEGHDVSPLRHSGGTHEEADSDLPTDLSSNYTKTHSVSVSPRGRGDDSKDGATGERPSTDATRKGAHDQTQSEDVPSGGNPVMAPPAASTPSPQRAREGKGGKSETSPRLARVGSKTATKTAAAPGTSPSRSPRTLEDYTSPEKHRRFADGAPPLPTSLAGLYMATLTHQEEHPHTTPLLYTLQLASDAFVRKRRVAAARLGREREKARCEALYNNALEWRAKTESVRERILREREEAILASCSFSPEVTQAARRLPGKGPDQFMEKCLEWEKEKASRLQARFAREEEVAGATAEPRINPNSRALAEKLARQGGGATRPALWEPKRRAGDTATLAGAEVHASLATEDRVPITSAEERRQRQLLKRLLAGDGSAAEDSEEDDDGGMDSTLSSQGRRVDVDEYLARMEDDIRRRNEKVDRLRKQQDDQDGGVAYASITGQPLFHPNAMPTVLRDGRRIPYNELSKEDRHEFRKYLRAHGQEYVLAQCLAAHREGGDSPADHGERPSLAGDVAAALDMAADRKARNMERLRAQLSVEETFKPRITPRSAKLAKDRTGGLSIYKRPIPPKYNAEWMKQQRQEEARRAQEAAAQRNSPAHAQAVKERTEQLLARHDMWQERREARLRRLAEQKAHAEMAACTFTPRRTLVHHLEDAASFAQSDASPPPAHQRRAEEDLEKLVDAAHVRLANEVELLRGEVAHMDPAFLARVFDGEHGGDALGTVSGESLPRPSQACSHLGRSTSRDASRYDLPFRVDAPTVGTTLSPQYLLGNLTRLNAPRLPRQPSSGATATTSAEASTGASRLHGASPIPLPHSARPSVSRSPSRRRWQQALLANGSSTHHPTSPASKVRGTEAPVQDVATDTETDDLGDLDYLPDPWAALDAQVDHILRRYE